MSFNFTVQKVEEYQGLEGEFIADVVGVDYIRSDYGNYPMSKWEIIEPVAFAGKIHKQNYKIEHSNDEVRRIAINDFSKFCVEVGGLKEGDQPKEEDFLYKRRKIRIRKNIGKDGKTYSNIVSMQELDNPGVVNNTPQNSTVMYGGIPVPNPAPESPIPLNDDVPF